MNELNYWPGTKVPRSTGNAFDLSLPPQISWRKQNSNHAVAASMSEHRSTAPETMSIDRPVGAAEKWRVDVKKIQIKPHQVQDDEQDRKMFFDAFKEFLHP